MMRRRTSAAMCSQFRDYLSCDCPEYQPPQIIPHECRILREVQHYSQIVIQDVVRTMKAESFSILKYDRALQVAVKVVSRFLKLQCLLFSIVERWTFINGERLIEDHEYIRLVKHESDALERKMGYTFTIVLKREAARFEVVHNPEEYFRTDMLLSLDVDPDTMLAREELLDDICHNGFCPTVTARAFKYNEDTQEWAAVHIAILEKRVIYAVHALHLYAFLIALRLMGKYDLGRNNFGIVKSVRLAHFTIYTTPRQNWGEVPEEAEVCFCLRPRDAISMRPVLFGMRKKDRDYFVAMMRLSKYGKRLVEDYVAMRKPITIEDVLYDPSDACNWATAGDFTRGRQLNYDWWHPSWRADKKTRGWAEDYLEAQSGEDGTFLVRDLHTELPLHYVLSYCKGFKIYHVPIMPRFDATLDKFVFSLDRSTEFYDIVQLVEYYMVNPGILRTTLTKTAEIS